MIKHAWHWIISLGVEDHHPEENDLIRRYNMLAITSGVASTFVALLAWWNDYPLAYVLVAGLISVMYYSLLVMNAFGYFVFARYFISVGTSIWFSITYVLIGGHFSQGVAVVAGLAIALAAFPKATPSRTAVIVVALVIYYLALLYVGIYGPVLGAVDIPFDEVVVFTASLGWAILLIYEFNKVRNNLVESLRTKNERLESTTEELERFTFIASHDLKSPLRTIISFINLMERDLQRKRYDRVVEHLDFVKTGALQLNALVQDILEFSKLRRYREKKSEIVNLNQVFAKAKQNLQEEIRAKQASVEGQNMPLVRGNEMEFLLLFQNFIQNGIKYNESSTPRVFVSAVRTPLSWNLTFRDNGIGIEKQYHETIFQFFKRLHTADEYEGTGLGLGLCKKIIDSYDGTIAVRSQVDMGSEFTISFPVNQFVANGNLEDAKAELSN